MRWRRRTEEKVVMVIVDRMAKRPVMCRATTMAAALPLAALTAASLAAAKPAPVPHAGTGRAATAGLITPTAARARDLGKASVAGQLSYGSCTSAGNCGSPAGASIGPRAGGPRATAAAAGGVISTVAGGVGGPARATKVALNEQQLNPDCGVTFGDGSLLVADSTSVRQVNPGTDQLTTPAGTGAVIPLANGGLATAANLRGTCSVAVDHFGNLILADGGGRIIAGGDGFQMRVVAASTGTFYGKAMRAGHIYVLAGRFGDGFRGDGGPATGALLNSPYGVAVDGAGNVVISDTGNKRIRVVAASTGPFYGQAMTAGDIYTVAGNGKFGFSGDGGPATKAELGLPAGVAVDGTGNLVFADNTNGRIRVVAVKTGTFYGQAMTAGDIYTVAGGGTSQADGVPATSAQFAFAAAVTVDGAGNLVISDAGSHRVRVVAKRAGTFYGQAMTADHIYTVAGDGTRGFSGDGGPATSARLSSPDGAAVDGAGNLVIADSGNNRVRVVAARTGTFYGKAMAARHIYTVAGNGADGFSGDGGPAMAAQMFNPESVAVDGSGNQVISDAFNNQVRVVAKRTGTFYRRAMTAGDIYTVAGNGRAGFSGDGGPATRAKFNQPYDTAVDGAGNLVIADFSNNRVRVLAVKTATFYGRAMTAGDIYTVAGNGTFGFSGDGGPATKAEIGRPWKIAVDATGNLVIADSFNNRVRVVAVKTGTFYSQAMTAGDIYTVAGGGTSFSDGIPATSAEIRSPIGLAVDAAGNLVIGDNDDARVRVEAVKTGTFYGQAMTAGDIYTVAGGGSQCGFGIPATSVALSAAAAVAVDGAGNLIFADGIGLVTVVAERTGTFYGVTMTAGDIYIVAGTFGVCPEEGNPGFGGDGGPATKALIDGAFGLAVDGTGNLLIADNDRIRMVTR
jgi:hypothetical protein